MTTSYKIPGVLETLKDQLKIAVQTLDQAMNGKNREIERYDKVIYETREKIKDLEASIKKLES